MDAQKRLDKFIAKGGVTFSFGYVDTKFLIDVSRVRGSESDSVGGAFDTFEEGINFCLDYLEKVSRKRTIKSVKKVSTK